MFLLQRNKRQIQALTHSQTDLYLFQCKEDFKTFLQWNMSYLPYYYYYKIQ